MFDAVGASAAALTVMLTIAAAADSASDVSVTLYVKLAVPFQLATGSNVIVPRLAAATVWPAVAAAVPTFSVPCPAAGSVTIFTDFSVCPSGSLNAPT